MRKSEDVVGHATPNDPVVEAALRASADLIACLHDDEIGVPSGTLSAELLGAVLATREAIENLNRGLLDPYRMDDGQLGLP